MNKKKLLISALVFAVLALLVYLQVRTWRKFDWHTFALATRGINLWWVFLGVALINADYFLRAMRWKILLRPVKQTTTARLVPATMIGFTGLALFGRPGELIRPYLIARKEGLTMSSQMAVWFVERIFDMGGFASIMAINVLLSASRLKELPGFHGNNAFMKFEIAGFVLLAGVGMMAAFLYLMRQAPDRIARWMERNLGRVSTRLAHAVSRRVHTFGEGLHTIADFKSFLQLSGLSVMIWLFIGIAYIAVTHAYADPALRHMTLSSVFLLTAASVVGGVLQLPVVGGGSQLATIGTLRGVFHLSPEIATSCGIMIWLVNFMSVIPGGLFFAHREHVSLTRVEEESIEEEEKLEAAEE